MYFELLSILGRCHHRTHAVPGRFRIIHWRSVIMVPGHGQALPAGLRRRPAVTVAMTYLPVKNEKAQVMLIMTQ
jgi:hypothetical protein